MKRFLAIWAVCVFSLLPACVHGADVEPSFYGDPPDANHPWAVHDPHRPQPPLVTPGTPSTQEQPGKPPSDAIILFDGTAASLEKWEADKEGHQPTKWVVRDGAMECTPGSGYIRTKEAFGDCQLHVEWAAPAKAEGSSQGRGNSGIFLMGMAEIQVLDNYNNPTYADGFAGSFYGIMPPLANALRAPGQYQVVDIVFRRPITKNGQVVDPGYVTVFLNGVLVLDHASFIDGPGGHRGRSRFVNFPEKGPLKLQDHGNPVRFRNIWYRPLPPRASEGGTDGNISPEAATAKRKEIAAGIRTEAEKRTGMAQMLRLMESLQYEVDAATLKKVEEQTAKYVASVKDTPADQMESKKDQAKYINEAFNLLVKAKAIPADFGPRTELQKIIKAQGWDRR